MSRIKGLPFHLVCGLEGATEYWFRTLVLCGSVMNPLQICFLAFKLVLWLLCLGSLDAAVNG